LYKQLRSSQQSFQNPEISRTTGLSPLAPAAVLLPLPPLVGVTDFDIGVVGFSPSSFLVDGVLAFEDVPLRGLDKRKRSRIPYLKKWFFHKDSSRAVRPAASDWQQTGGIIIRFLAYTGGLLSALFSTSVPQLTQTPVQCVLRVLPPEWEGVKCK
jgi:hypothetical protein